MLNWPDLQPELSDGVIRLRAWREADVEQVFDACQDDEILRWTTLPSPYTYADADRFVTVTARADWKQRVSAHLCVCAADDGARVLAGVGVHRVEEGNLAGEIGYWVAPWARRQGVAVRAVRLAVAWAFGELGLRRLDLKVMAGNHASKRVADRAGFAYEGTQRARARRGGQLHDLVLYGLVAPGL